jgi:hypothetical protein
MFYFSFCGQEGDLMVTVSVFVSPQMPQPLSTPAVIVYVPGLTPLKSHVTFAPLPTIFPAETV